MKTAKLNYLSEGVTSRQLFRRFIGVNITEYFLGLGFSVGGVNPVGVVFALLGVLEDGLPGVDVIILVPHRDLLRHEAGQGAAALGHPTSGTLQQVGLLGVLGGLRILPGLLVLPPGGLLSAALVPEHGEGVGHNDALVRDVVDSLRLGPLLDDAELGAADGSVGVVEDLDGAVPGAHQQLVDLGVPLGPDTVALPHRHLEHLLEGVAVVEDHLAPGLALLLAGAGHHQPVVGAEEDIRLVKPAEQSIRRVNWLLETPANERNTINKYIDMRQALQIAGDKFH